MDTTNLKGPKIVAYSHFARVYPLNEGKFYEKHLMKINSATILVISKAFKCKDIRLQTYKWNLELTIYSSERAQSKQILKRRSRFSGPFVDAATGGPRAHACLPTSERRKIIFPHKLARQDFEHKDEPQHLSRCRACTVGKLMMLLSLSARWQHS
jgi:hypothetical protein